MIDKIRISCLCILTALNSRQQADTAPVDADFLRPVKSVFHLGSGVSSSLYLGRESIHYTRPARERCMGRSCWRCSSSRPFFYSEKGIEQPNKEAHHESQSIPFPDRPITPVEAHGAQVVPCAYALVLPSPPRTPEGFLVDSKPFAHFFGVYQQSFHNFFSL